MHQIRFSLTLVFCFSVMSVFAQNKIKVSVSSGGFERKDCVVSMDLADIDWNGKGGFSIHETTKGNSQDINCQIIREKGSAKLYWILNGTTPKNSSREFTIKKESAPGYNFTMNVERNDSALILKKNGKGILQYNYAMKLPPEGRMMAYMRSGFIHPAYSPAGNILSNIQPADHTHHYGIWNPWTRLEYDGVKYDLWNLKDLQGTVRAESIDAIYRGGVCAGYRASLDHMIFTPSEEKKIMDETWTIKSWNTPGGYLWDFESELVPSTKLPVLLKSYRYAGLTLRATPDWNRETCEMLSSEGKTRNNMDGTTARWVFIGGKCGNNGTSGLMFMSHPENHNHPEPLRIWNERMSRRGEAFVNFVPTQKKDWELESGKKYNLKYRVYMYDGKMTAEEADRLWNDFAFPPEVTVIR